jgi:prepilin-type processing-associated H-X9-DG protein
MAAPAFAATGTIIPRVDPTAPKTIIPGLTTRHPYEEMHNQVFIKEMRDGMSSTALFSERLSWRGKIEQVTFGSERDERLRVYFATGLNRISYNNGWDGKSEDFMVLIDACRNLPPDARAAGGLRGDRWYLGHPLLLNYAVYNHSMTPNSPSCSNLNLGLRGLDIYGAAPPSSNHLGGVNLGFADGSVRFIKDSVNWKVWRAIGTRKYGEVVSQDDY